MGVPKRKMSKMRLRTRKAANRWHATGLTICGHCSSRVRPHIVCPTCGYYGDRKVIEVESI